MKQRQILIRVFLAILCLPLSACLWGVSSGTVKPKQYPISADGTVDLTNVSSTALASLKLSGFNLSGNYNVSLECNVAGTFTPIVFPAPSTSPSINVSNFWTTVSQSCTQQPVGDDHVIELALKLGEKYAPIFTPDNVNCVVQGLMQQQQLKPAIAGCVALDPREPGPSTDPLGLNSSVEGINVLTLLLP